MPGISLTKMLPRARSTSAAGPEERARAPERPSRIEARAQRQVEAAAAKKKSKERTRAPAGGSIHRENVGYELEILARHARAAARASRLMVLFVFTTLFFAMLAAYQSGRPRSEPFVVLVDAVGATEIIRPMTGAPVTVPEVFTRANIRRYITARESFSWSTAEADYELIGLMSDPSVGAVYSRVFADNGYPTQAYGPDALARINIISVVPNAEGREIRAATVRFNRTVLEPSTGRELESKNFTVTMGFRYDPTLPFTDRERELNPLGFRVTAYRRDEEEFGGGT